jgi:hypothetical protein
VTGNKYERRPQANTVPKCGKQQAENANGHFSIKNFIKALRNASNAFKLVWEASKHNALFNFGLTPIAALMPAAQAWVGKLFVDNILGVLNANMVGKLAAGSAASGTAELGSCW